MEKRYSNGCSDLLLDIRFVHFTHLLTSSCKLKRTDLVSNRQEIEKKETPSSHQRKPLFTTKEASLQIEKSTSFKSKLYFLYAISLPSLTETLYVPTG